MDLDCADARSYSSIGRAAARVRDAHQGAQVRSLQVPARPLLPQDPRRQAGVLSQGELGPTHGMGAICFPDSQAACGMLVLACVRTYLCMYVCMYVCKQASQQARTVRIYFNALLMHACLLALLREKNRLLMSHQYFERNTLYFHVHT